MPGTLRRGLVSRPVLAAVLRAVHHRPWGDAGPAGPDTRPAPPAAPSVRAPLHGVAGAAFSPSTYLFSDEDRREGRTPGSTRPPGLLRTAAPWAAPSAAGRRGGLCGRTSPAGSQAGWTEPRQLRQVWQLTSRPLSQPLGPTVGGRCFFSSALQSGASHDSRGGGREKRAIVGRFPPRRHCLARLRLGDSPCFVCVPPS